MIKLIGLSRLFVIICLGALFVLLAIYYHFSAVPSLADSSKELRKNNREISKLSNDLDELKNGMEEFKGRQDEFVSIRDQYDFFNPQDRVQARRQLNVIRDLSRVTSAQYNIRPAVTEEKQSLRDAGYKLLNTPIEFTLKAIEDKDIYTYLYHLNYSFPGVLIIDEVSISRDAEVTQPLLRDIGTGREDIRSLVTARVTTSWRTVVPDPSISIEEGGQ